MLATGIEPGVAAAAAACGLELPIRRTRQRVAGVRFFYVERDDTTIGSIGFDTAALPPSIDRAVTVVEPGAVVSPPPKGTVWGRIGYAVAIGASADECSAALDAAQAALRVTVA
jgi:hypothetical protein